MREIKETNRRIETKSTCIIQHRNIIHIFNIQIASDRFILFAVPVVGVAPFVPVQNSPSLSPHIPIILFIYFIPSFLFIVTHSSPHSPTLAHSALVWFYFGSFFSFRLILIFCVCLCFVFVHACDFGSVFFFPFFVFCFCLLLPLFYFGFI